MFRSLIVAGSIALGVLGGVAITAPAQADVRVYLGVPFHPYQVGPGWRYYDGYGWYDYGRYGAFRPYNNGYYPRKLTCNQARRMVDRNGYSKVDARDCSGRTYSFRASRNGKRHTVYVNAFTGDMWR
jgi:hypothetical protein